MSDTYVRLSRVAAVRPSGVDKATVAGEVPVRLCNYTDVYYGDRLTAAQGFMEASATAEEVRRFELRRDDVVLTKDSETADDIAIPAWVAEDLDGVVLGYHTALIRPSPDVDGRYLYWLLQSKASQTYFELAARGVTRCGLRQEDLARLPVPALALPEQRRIADYLDREIERIDAIMGMNQQLLTLLRERFSTLAARLLLERFPTDDPVAVLAGRAVGLPRVKHLVSDQFAGKTPKEGTHWVDPGETDAVPWLGVGDFAHGIGADSASRYLDRASLADLGLRTMPPGTVLFAMYGATAGKVAPLEIEATWNQAVLGLLPDPRRVHKGYLVEWLKLAGPAARVLSRSNTQDNFNAEQVLNFPVPLPPVQVQMETVSRITEERIRLDNTTRLLTRQHDLILERRQALITAAVTGQLDVGEAA